MKIVVSMALMGNRVAEAEDVVRSLLSQSIPLDRIYINASRAPFLRDSGLPSTPEWLAELGDPRVKLNFTKNVGPYRKLIPLAQNWDENDWIVTVDDDVLYHETWLESLVEAAEANPSAIICGAARRMLRAPCGGYQSYVYFPWVDNDTLEEELIPIGASGILYRRRLVDLRFLLDDRAQALAPSQDDIWFREASRRLGTPVFVCGDSGRSRRERPAGPESLAGLNKKLPGSRWARVRFLRRIAGGMGLPLVENDRALKSVRRYSRRLQ